VTSATRIGLVAGLQSERAALGALGDDPRLLTEVTGADPERAEIAARALVKAGCDLLVSWGMAGGLDPALAPGTLVAPDAVMDEHRMRFPLVNGSVGNVLIYGSETPVLTQSDKARLREEHGAVAVDMESHRVAKVARESDVPCAAIRVVVDPADHSLPKTVAGAVGTDGRARLRALLGAALRRPALVRDLLRLKRQSDAALATLAGAGCRRLAGWLPG